jgi:hypothetical protein
VRGGRWRGVVPLFLDHGRAWVAEGAAGLRLSYGLAGPRHARATSPLLLLIDLVSYNKFTHRIKS